MPSLSTLIRSIRRIKLGQIALGASSLILAACGGYLNSNPQAHINAINDPFAILIDGNIGTMIRFREFAMYFFMFANILIVLDLQSQRFPLSRFMGPFLDSLGCLGFIILAIFQWDADQVQNDTSLIKVSKILAFHFTVLAIFYCLSVVLGVVFHLSLPTEDESTSDSGQVEEAKTKSPSKDAHEIDVAETEHLIG